MTIGIYKLNFNDGSFYIGQSINIERRFKDHCYSLISGRSSVKLQNKYKELKKLPSLEILSECLEEELNQYENESIEIWDAVNKGLNVLDKAEALPKGNTSCGELNPTARYSNEQYEQVLFLLLEPDMQHNEIAEKTGVGISAIKQISRGCTNLWLKDKYPTEYSLMLNINRRRVNNLVKLRPIIQDSKGNKYDLSGKNITEFIKEHNLGKHFYSVLSGKRKTHKGWTLVKEETC